VSKTYFCPECGHRLDADWVCVRCLYAPTIEERVALMNRGRILKGLLQQKKDGLLSMSEYQDAIGV